MSPILIVASSDAFVVFFAVHPVIEITVPPKVPAWTTEIRERTAKVAIAALVHASEHGDTGYAAKLLSGLPADGLRASLAVWFNKQTPIHVGAVRGKIFARLRNDTDPNSRLFNLPKSKTALREFLCPGLRFANLPEGSEIAKEIKGIENHFKRSTQIAATPDFKTAALKALAHANAHGDVTAVQRVVDNLPMSIWTGGFRAWLYAYSPIRRDRKTGRWHQAKPSDDDYQPYDLEGAANALVLRSSPPNIASLLRDDRFLKWGRGLPSFSHEELFEAYKSLSDGIVSRNLTDDPKVRRTISAIADEWRRRRDDEDYFSWPSTDAPMGLARLGTIDAPDLGILAALGYRVGKTHGQPDELRRFVLDYVFQGDLPPINDASYMSQWDKPLSSRRLRKMANTIASFIRNFKRKASGNYELAILHWNDDLSYLHQRYYVGMFGFEWPDV
jgi:hypothetical protein